MADGADAPRLIDELARASQEWATALSEEPSLAAAMDVLLDALPGKPEGARRRRGADDEPTRGRPRGAAPPEGE